MIHIVKSWPKFFEPIRNGDRKHELRKNDRNYNVGDYLWLMYWCPEKQEYNGQYIVAEITSITSKEEPCAISDNGLNEEYVILSIKVIRYDNVLNFKGTRS